MKTVCLVFANSDTTEGRGPMRLVKVVSTSEKGIAYAQSRYGVMGRTCPLEEEKNVNFFQLMYPGISKMWTCNDHDIVVVNVEE